MLYVVPSNVIGGIVAGVFFAFMFAAYIALTSRTGQVMDSPWSGRMLSKSAANTKYYNDYSNLNRFYHYLTIAAVSCAALFFVLYGFDMYYILAIIIFAAIDSVAAAIALWCILIFKVKDKK